MKHIVLAATLVVSLASVATAQQQVTLKSGAIVVGDVKFDNGAVLINLDGTETRIPFTEIDTVASASFSKRQQAQQLLLRGLESRLNGSTPKDTVVLLLEASQLDPENPHIAYWLATNLLEAGYGKIARKKYENLREAVDEAYPDGASRLASAIEHRVAIEALDPKLVARIDAFNANPGAPDPDNPHMKRMAAVVRVLDQHQDPIDQSAIRVEGNGGEERLEQFADGYFFYSALNGNDEEEQDCNLIVSQNGLQQTRRSFRVSSLEASVALEIAVHRFADSDKRPARILVQDADGEPLAGIRVQLQPNQSGGSEPLVATTDDKGVASFTAFPGAYVMNAAGEGFNPFRDQILIDEQDPEGAEEELVLYPALAGSIRLEWRSKSWQGGGETTSGSTTLNPSVLDAGGYFGDSIASSFRLGQALDKLVLQITRYNYGPPTGAGAAVKRLKSSDAASGEEHQRRAEKVFKELDLATFDQLGEEYEAAPIDGGAPNGQSAVRIPLRPGDVLVGRTTGRDMRTGQPLEVTYKALVETTAEASDESR